MARDKLRPPRSSVDVGGIEGIWDWNFSCSRTNRALLSLTHLLHLREETECGSSRARSGRASANGKTDPWLIARRTPPSTLQPAQGFPRAGPGFQPLERPRNLVIPQGCAAADGNATERAALVL